MRVVGRDLIRGGHYGQRSCEPHLKAEHMAAPTNAAKREKSSCQSGAVHTWHNSDMPRWSLYVRYRGNSGCHLLGASISLFDPAGHLTTLNRPTKRLLSGWGWVQGFAMRRGLFSVW